MSIRRATLPSDNFTQISNRWLRDERLSWKARGVLGWLASHKVGFEVSESTIIRAAPEGRDSVRAGLGELEAFGYLVRERQRSSNGTFCAVDYILCDPWSVEKTQVSFSDGNAVHDEAARRAATTENPSKVVTSGNKAKSQVRPATGDPAVASTWENAASPQVGTNDGFSTPIRRPENQKTKKTKKPVPLRAGGALTVGDARGSATTSAANRRDLSRLAGDILGQMPAHYRSTAPWMRKRLLAKIADALAGHTPLAIIEYSARFIADPGFGDYEHLRRLDDVLRKLTADIADATACSGCGRDPRHPFCSANPASLDLSTNPACPVLFTSPVRPDLVPYRQDDQ